MRSLIQTKCERKASRRSTNHTKRNARESQQLHRASHAIQIQFRREFVDTRVENVSRAKKLIRRSATWIAHGTLSGMACCLLKQRHVGLISPRGDVVLLATADTWGSPYWAALFFGS